METKATLLAVVVGISLMLSTVYGERATALWEQPVAILEMVVEARR